MTKYMKKIVKEFKEFAVKGNAIELATAVIIGGAFGKIVSSLVADVVMPLVSLMIGGNTFADWQVTLRPAMEAKPALIMNLGLFLQNIIDFLIIATVIFLMVKILVKLKKQLITEKEEPTKEIQPTKDQELLTEIRDLLKK